MIYFDNAATTFHKPEGVAEAVVTALSGMGNAGRGAHKAMLAAARTVYDTREELAELFHIPYPEQIAFTCNATEALNTAIQGLFEQGDHVITTVCEHNSVLRPLYLMEKQGVEVSHVTADAQGILRYEEFEKLCRPNTKAVVITHASNLTGNLTDLNFVHEFVKKHNLLLVVDASQTAGVVPIDVEAMGIDVLCFTGHKGLLGPQGTGGICVRKGVNVRPLKVGGSGIHSYDKEQPSVMPTALEAGTLNGHGIAGLHASVQYLLETGVEQVREREMELASYFISQLKKNRRISLYGNPDLSKRVAIVTLNVADLDSAIVADELWEQGEIAVRAGAHCAPLMHEALKTVDQGAVRFSFSEFNTKEEIDIAVEILKELAQ